MCLRQKKPRLETLCSVESRRQWTTYLPSVPVDGDDGEKWGNSGSTTKKCNRAAAAITGAAQNLVQQEESSNYQGRFASHGCVPSIQPTGQRHIVCLMVASHRIKSSSFLDTLSSSGPLRPRPIFLLSFLLPYPSCSRSEWWGMSLAGLWLFNLYVSLGYFSLSLYYSIAALLDRLSSHSTSSLLCTTYTSTVSAFWPSVSIL
jgi:hypothetical protein